jgi:hypothetical protein
MNGLDGVEDVAFGAAERRQAEERELGLEFADVVLTKGQIMGKIPGAAAMGFMEDEGAL